MDIGDGHHTILYGNGRTWVKTPTPTIEGGLWALTTVGNDGWAAGDGGQFMRYNPLPTVHRIYLPGIDVQRAAAAPAGAMPSGGKPCPPPSP